MISANCRELKIILFIILCFSVSAFSHAVQNGAVPDGKTDAGGNPVFMVVSDIHYAGDPPEFNKALGDREMKIPPGPVLENLRRKILEIKPSFVMVLGDMGASIKDLPIESAVKCLEKLNAYLRVESIPVYFAVGNHEVCSKHADPFDIYKKFYGQPYYSFDSGGVHFIVLNTHAVASKKMNYEVDKGQLGWLAKDLESTNASTPVIIFSHEPVFDLNQGGNNQELMNLFSGYGINAHITGHWHQMAKLRDRPFPEITCGSLCAGWWEGPAPTGEFMGYSLFTVGRGAVDYGFFNVNADLSVWIELPLSACLSDIPRIRIVASKPLPNPVLSIDGVNYPFPPEAVQKRCWTEYYYNLNVTSLKDGKHTIVLSANGSPAASKDIWVRNQNVTLNELYDNQTCFEGRVVSLDGLDPNIKWGGYIGFSKDGETIMAKTEEAILPFKVVTGEKYSVTGIYRNQFKVIDPLNFYETESIMPDSGRAGGR